jgi:hypothetical protein
MLKFCPSTLSAVLIAFWIVANALVDENPSFMSLPVVAT